MLTKQLPQKITICFPHVIRMLMSASAGRKTGLSWPQSELAEKTDLSDRSLRDIVYGKSLPRSKTVRSIEEALSAHEAPAHKASIVHAIASTYASWAQLDSEQRRIRNNSDARRIGVSENHHTTADEHHYLEYLRDHVLTQSVEEQFILEADKQGYRTSLKDFHAEHTVRRPGMLKKLSGLVARETVRITLVRAFGGFGKTSLVEQWQQENGRSPTFSFYTDGQSDASSLIIEFERFIVLCAGIDWEDWDKELHGAHKARLLLEALKDRSLTIVLDGMEVVQCGPGDSKATGHIRDVFLRNTLQGLCEAKTSTKLIITSRLPLPDLKVCKGNQFEELPLPGLTPEEGIELLKLLGVSGQDKDLARLVDEHEGYPLSLQLIGSLISEAYEGDLTKSAMMSESLLLPTDNKYREKAWRILSHYETSVLAAKSDLLLVLQLASSFSRQPSIESIRAVARAMREEFSHLAENEMLLHSAASSLLRLRLINGSVASFTIHPLVSEFFMRRLSTTNHELYIRFQSAICDLYLDKPEQEFAETVQDARDLSTAIYHGVRAGREFEMQRVYFHRIQRKYIKDGELTFFLRKRLGELDLDLETLSHFFTDRSWRYVHKDADSALIQNEFGYVMTGRGMIEESVPITKTANRKLFHQVRRNFGKSFRELKWKEQQRVVLWAKNVKNLATTYFFLGDLRLAKKTIDMNRKAIRELPISHQARMSFLALDGAFMHHQGNINEANRLFQEGEAVAREDESNRIKRLHSFNGFLYHRLLFDRGEFDVVQDRYENHGVSWSERKPGQLSYGLQEYHHLMIEYDRHVQTGSNFERVQLHARNSVDALSRTAVQLVPYPYIELVRIYRLEGEHEQCAAYALLADEIVSNTGQTLLIIDLIVEVLLCRLEFGSDFPNSKRLSFSAMSNRELLSHARSLSKRTNYRRRDLELQALSQRLT